LVRLRLNTGVEISFKLIVIRKFLLRPDLTGKKTWYPTRIPREITTRRV
jgi:hypothetical protein